MVNKKIEELKEKFKISDKVTYSYQEIIDYIDNNFKLEDAKDENIHFQINNRQSGCITVEYIDKEQIKIKAIDTDIIKPLNLANSYHE